MEAKNKNLTPLPGVNKKSKQKIAMLTAYDYPLAKMLDQAGIDIILVGDSLANVILGYKNTLPVKPEEMLHHLKAVRRGVKRAVLLADLPRLAFKNEKKAIQVAKQFIKEGADGVKIEGTKYLSIIKKLVKSGIPVMGHIGFTPQFIHELGGYKTQGKTQPAKRQMLQAAQQLEKAGCFALVIEMTDEETAGEITRSINIPAIGCGAGRFCDGQVLVTHDILGLYEDFIPRFAKRYVNLAPLIRNAVRDYIKDVKVPL